MPRMSVVVRPLRDDEVRRFVEIHHAAVREIAIRVTAEPFYRALGYEVEARGEHLFRSGKRMASVNTRKVFR